MVNRYVLPIQPDPSNIPPALDVRDQTPAYPVPQRAAAPGNAPNVLLILVDDMGFGASSAFGGPCRMPAAERLAADGLKYNRFHTTAICAPTRAALLTGRNHHSTGMGTVPELATSAPGYNCIRPASMATITRVLSCNGYATGAFGKMHQTPGWELGETGPFDRWPTNEGFDRFYGFLGAETNQFTPRLHDGLTPIEPPKTAAEGYHLSEDLVDRATEWITNLGELEPGRPWFCHLSFGACHDPLHVPDGWRGRYRGEFAHGWDVERERIFQRQKELGVVPPDAELPPWDPEMPRWDELDDDQRVAAERLMELYAEFAEHMDSQVGRLIDALDDLGQLDNTLVFYILGDNGAAAEGGVDGSANLAKNLNQVPSSAAEIVAQLDELGGPSTYPHYPIAWATVMDTPYQWSKKFASHYGGTRNGMIVHWPAGFTSRGEIRSQWHHCIDVAPTILEAAGLPEPEIVDGVRQSPVEGTSFHYTFDGPEEPDRHITQYFEMLGSRGIYHDGWTAVARHRDSPASTSRAPLPSFTEDVWELYETRSDWTQARDLADQHPEKLAALQQKFLIEAVKHGVLPLDDRLFERFIPNLAPRPDLLGDRKSMVLHPSMRGLPEDCAPNLKNTSFTLLATVDVPPQPADGVLVAQGSRFAGWSLYVNDGRPVYCYNMCGDRIYVHGADPLRPGRREVELRFTYDGGGIGKGGTATILVDGEITAEGRLPRTVGFKFSMDETLDVGRDRGTPVSEEYCEGIGNAYQGTLRDVFITLGEDSVAVDPASQREVALRVH
ncbi:arylsulfatase [Saccharopolyspora sp. NPDC003752]